MKIKQSKKLLKRAKKVIPSGALNISKDYRRFVRGVSPAFVDSVNGCYIWDADGNKFIDVTASMGTIILGYSYLDNPFYDYNPIFPLSNFSEVELAEKLVDIIPCAEMVKFFKTGADACSAGTSLARKINGRVVDKGLTVSTGYHGWHNSVNNLRKFIIEYGDLKGLEKVFSEYDVACYILEPMDRSCPEKFSWGILADIRKLCDKYNVILIFDEILSGFRFGLSGIQGGSKLIEPDLACYGKAMSNGYPISALVGKKELMKEIKNLHISGTYFGELLSIDMALKTIEYMEENKVLDYTSKMGDNLYKRVFTFISRYDLTDYVGIKKFDSWLSFNFKDINMEQFFLEYLVNNGLLYCRDNFIMYSHTKEILSRIEEIYDGAFYYLSKWIKDGMPKNKLKGKYTRDLF